MNIIMASTGETVALGRMVQAQTGAHTGTWWRLDDVVHNGREHIARVSRHIGRSRRVAAFPLHVFGLVVQEVTRWWHRVVRVVVHKVDDYMLAGLFALVPLAFFERYHGAEVITEWVEYIHH